MGISIIPVEKILLAYRTGIFPMSNSRYDSSVKWYKPLRRGIIPIENFKISKNVLKWIRNKPHRCTIDTAFREVVLACADRESTWISDMIIESYCNLFKHGYAHSVEIWVEDNLVGGLYGVHYQSAFFGETMFKRKPEMDKVALYYCWLILRNNGFMLWDAQFWTAHLAQFGCIEIPIDQYLNILNQAMQHFSDFHWVNP